MRDLLVMVFILLIKLQTFLDQINFDNLKQHHKSFFEGDLDETKGFGKQRMLTQERQLASVPDPSQSTISGNGTTGPLVAFLTYQVILTAKDELGNNILTGGESFEIFIQNEGTVISGVTGTEVAGATQTLSSPITGPMIDNSDGTYSYSFSVDLDGKISILIVQTYGEGISVQYFPNDSFSGSPAKQETVRTINFDWTSIGTPLPGFISYFSSIYTSKLYPPVTGSYTINLLHDDGSQLLLDGNVLINRLGIPGAGIDNATVSLTAGQGYDLKILYYQRAGNYHLFLNWEGPGIGLQVIPRQYLSEPSVVGSGPLTIPTTCPDGFSTGPTEGITIGGDGLRAGTEVGDHGNIIDLDGCTEDCSQIEPTHVGQGGTPTSPDVGTPIGGDARTAGNEVGDDGNEVHDDGGASDGMEVTKGYICENGDYYTVDACSKGPTGYISNERKNEGIVGPISSTTQIFQILTFAAIGAGASSSLIDSFLRNGSLQSSFSGLNFVQLLLLLPLLGAFLPFEVLNYIRSISMSMIKFNFFSINTSWVLFKVIYSSSFEQEDNKLNLIGIESGSSFANIVDALFVLGLLFAIHLLILPVYGYGKGQETPSGIVKIVIRIFKDFTIGVYIRTYFESYLIILLAILSDIYRFEFYSRVKQISLIFSIIIGLFGGLILVIVLGKWISTRIGFLMKNQAYLKELYGGVKNTIGSRSFSLIFLVRRTLLGAIAVMVFISPNVVKIGVFAFFQTGHMSYISILRPFEISKDNLIEIINEVFYTILCGLLIYFNIEKRWTTAITYTYIGIMVGVNLIIAFISVVSLLASLGKRGKNKKQVLPKVIESKIESNTPFNNNPIFERQTSNPHLSVVKGIN